MSNKRKTNTNDQVSKRKSPLKKINCDDEKINNNNFDCPLYLSFVGDRQIVERKEFVDYQNKTNININNMIGYLNDLGTNFHKTNELVNKQAKHIDKLENEIKSLKDVLSITKKGKKYERNSNFDTNIKDHNYTIINNENLNPNDKELKNSKNNDIIDHINESIDLAINSITNSINDDTNDSTNNLNGNDNERLVQFYPNSKLLVNNKRLTKSLKSCTYTAFVSKMMTGLFSVEDIFMKNLKGGKSISNFGLQKKSFSEQYIDEIYKAVEHYFPNQIQNAKDEWKKEVNKAINSKLFVLNKHLCGLILNNDSKKSYKLGKFDSENFRNYERYRENPDELKNLLIEMYGEQALDFSKNLNANNQFNDTESIEFEEQELNNESYEINNLENKLIDKNDLNNNLNDNLIRLDIQKFDKNNFNDLNSLNITQFQEAVILDQDFFNIMNDSCTNLNNE